MSEQIDFSKLAFRAQQGDKGAMDRLAELASQRLRVYVYRLTLQDDLTQEIVQETLLEMCKVIGNLKDTDRFLPWLYGIATNKLRHFYRSEQAMKRATSRSMADQSELDRQEGLETLLSQELRDIITNAIESLKTNHRAVLIMRCYDGMSYAEIAESMGCSEFGSRMLFLRAKKALQKQLARNGLGKGSLLAALLFFGKMTSPSEAAAAQLSITAATTKVGAVAATAGFAASKGGLVSLAAAGALAVGTTVGPLNDWTHPLEEAESSLALVDRYQSDLSKGYDMRLFYKSGAPGAVVRRMELSPVKSSSGWAILENADACYYLQGDRSEKRNARQWRPYVARLPWDSKELRGFLQRMDGYQDSLPTIQGETKNDYYGFVRNLQTGEIEVSRRKDLRVLHEDIFLSDWGTNVNESDARDTMHQRGWTYFRVSGNVDGQIVSGRGCLPFVLSQYQDHKPWLRIDLGSDEWVDSTTGAWIKHKETGDLQRLESGSFFTGLSRPWMGLHCLDSVRRDAAVKRFSFTTQFNVEQDLATVTVECNDGIQLEYSIDLEADLIQRIDLFSDGQKRGEITFDYLQEVQYNQKAFRDAQPSSHPPLGQRIDSQGLAWISGLLNTH